MRIHRSLPFLFFFLSILTSAISRPINLTTSSNRTSINWVDPLIVQRGSATTGTTNSNTLTIAKPAGIAVGDVLITNISYSKSNNDATSPTASGWTVVANARIDDAVNYRAVVMYKVVEAADLNSNPYSFAFTSNLYSAVGAITAFVNVDVSGASPFDVASNTINVSNGANIASVVANGLLTSSNNSAILMLTQSDGEITFDNTVGSATAWRTTSPGTLTEIYDIAYDGKQAEDKLSVGMAWGIKTSAGSTGNGLVNQSAANNFGAILLALKPITTVQPTPSITSTLTATSEYGSSSSYQITASYSPTSYSAATLPTGMSVDAATGLINVGANTPAGNYSISLTATNASGTGTASTLNYTVTGKALTITATNVLKCFGAIHTFNTALFTSSGLIPGETISAVDMNSEGALSSAAVGAYSIVPSNATGTNGFLAANYEITYQSTGTLSVRPLNSWHGNVSTVWTNTANWCLASALVPGAADAAIIYPSNNSPELGDSYSLSDLTINAGASILLKTANNGTTNTFTIFGSLTNDGLLDMEANTRVIFGTGAHTVSGSAITSFVNLTVNSGSNITLNQSIQVTNNLTLTSGYLVPAADKLVSIENGATVTGASNTSYVRGAVKKIGTNGNTNYIFSYPIGKPSVALYDPVAITFPVASTTDDVMVSYHEAAFNTTQKNNNIREVAPEYWNITPGSLVANASGLNVKLHYKSADGGKYFTNATNVSYYKVGHYNGSTWEVAVGLDAAKNSTDAGSTLAEGFGIANGVTAFSRFTMLEIVASVLPVKLSHFNARHLPENRVGLSWSTEFEQQNKGFIIERAGLPSQGKFQKIGYVFSKGISGSSSAPLNYSFTESVPNGETYAYYRIVQEDLDGKLSPSEIKLLKFNVGTPTQIAVQSTTGRVTISRNPGAKKMNYRVTDQMGRIITEGKGIVDQVFMLQISSNGIYNIQLFIPETGEQLIKRVLVQK
jgi:hypothetical protein